ncbi:MAG: hypothetical protein WC309_03350 [Candidatus Paceibacterota bacterium]|jgi:uncharacterized coiled-coil DUF342 family protein
MDKDYSELIQYLDEKFINIDNRFVNIDNRFVDIESILETKADRADINTLTSAVDAYAKKADTYFQEMVMLSHKVDRIEKWVVQLADKAGLKLQY